MRARLGRMALLQRRPGESWPLGKRAGFWSWNLLLYLLCCAGVGLISLILAVGPYDLTYCDGFWETPLLLALNILPVLGLGLVLYGLIGFAQWSFLLTALITLLLSAGNYWKLVFRDDPLMFGDLTAVREAGNMLNRYQLYWDKTMVVTVALPLLAFLFLWLLGRGRPRWKLRLCVALAGLAVLGALLPAILSQDLYDGAGANYEHLESRWSATQQYMAHGLVYPFLHSVTDTVELAPEGYSQKDAEAILEGYTDADIPADRQVNVIGIMLEAYNDFSKFGVPELSRDVYEVWHQLEAEGCAGNLVTNIFGGGTVDTERLFLTGYSSLHEIRGDVNAYPWYFRQQGYTVEGMHPSPQWFYNRSNVNSNLGFQDYFFMENYFNRYTTWETAGDDIFFPALLERYREMTADGTPYFNFSVTYQGHGPYSSDSFYWEGGPEDYVVNNGYTDEELTTLANYFASVYNTNENLKMLTDALREDETPVILVLFGDHNPWMGDGNALYNLLGIDLNQSTETGFLNYYATRYIIWANDAAKTVLGRDISGQGPDLSPGFLMNQV